MPRYAAFLRGVSPMNCRMPELKRALESAGFDDVKTLLSSGNAVFTAGKASNESLQKKCEAAMQKHLGQAFVTFVRPVDELVRILASDPYKGFRLQPAHKRIVTFVRTPPKGKLDLPIELDGASIVAMKGTEIFSAYLPTAKGPVFMTLLQKTFGKEQTTRTWQTIEKTAR